MSDDLFAPEHFRYTIRQHVRFRDVDALQHVNHAVYLTYMESARTRYMRDVLGWDGDMQTLGLILARIEVDYRLPLHFNEQVEVRARIARLGNKSIDMLYLLRRIVDDEPAAVVATGKTALVTFQYSTSSSISVPDDWRQQIKDYEPAL